MTVFVEIPLETFITILCLLMFAIGFGLGYEVNKLFKS